MRRAACVAVCWAVVVMTWSGVAFSQELSKAADQPVKAVATSIALQSRGDEPRRTVLLDLTPGVVRELAFDAFEYDKTNDQGKTVWPTFLGLTIDGVLSVEVVAPVEGENLTTLRVRVKSGSAVVNSVTEVDDRESSRTLDITGIEQGAIEIAVAKDGSAPLGATLVDQDKVSTDASMALSALSRALELAFVVRPADEVGATALWTRDEEVIALGVTAAPVKRTVRVDAIEDDALTLGIGQSGYFVLPASVRPYWLQGGANLVACEVSVEGSSTGTWKDGAALPSPGRFEREDVVRAEYTIKGEGIQATMRHVLRLNLEALP